MEAVSQAVDVRWSVLRSLLIDAATAPGRREDVADLIATLLDLYVHSADFASYFRRWQARGVHVTPVHFYSPVPDTSRLPDTVWEKQTALSGIDLAESSQLSLLASFKRLQGEYNSLPFGPTSRAGEFYLDNPMFSGTDALVLYCMIRHFQPSSVVEVGAGFSTRLLVDAARRNGPTRIVSIEPHPDEVLRRQLLPIELIDRRVQDVPVSLFESLQRDDVLFIDSSHVVSIDGDVPYLFLEVLPRLRPGVLVHVHDIFLPRQLPREWVVERMRFWCEQELLQAFLAFNQEFEVVLANSYLALRHEAAMRDVFPRSPWWGGGSFWMRRSGVNRS